MSGVRLQEAEDVVQDVFESDPLFCVFEREPSLEDPLDVVQRQAVSVVDLYDLDVSIVEVVEGEEFILDIERDIDFGTFEDVSLESFAFIGDENWLLGDFGQRISLERREFFVLEGSSFYVGRDDEHVLELADFPSLYCTPEDVLQFFDKEEFIRQDGDPAREQVWRRIESETSWVEQYTGHAWRSVQVKDEFHDLDSVYRWSAGSPISLTRREIRTPLRKERGDALELWRGNGYQDFIQDFTESREQDFWFDSPRGTLFLFRRSFWKRYNEIRISFRYGEREVPGIIRDSVARRVAAFYLESQQYRMLTPGNDEAPNPDQVAKEWREQAEEDLKEFKEIRSTGVS